MLGLLYGTVALVPYTPEWERAFADEASPLRDALAPWSCRIEHVGSTAVPGLLAKPILDIAVGVPASAAIEAVVSALEGLCYEYRGDAGGKGGHVLVRESRRRVRTHHLHVVRLDDEQWTAYLDLRDFLRADDEARNDYLDAKRALANRHGDDRRAYTMGKAEIIGQLLARARAVK